MINLTSVTMPLMVKPTVAQTQTSQLEELNGLLEQALQQSYQGQPLHALEKLQQALAIARQLKNQKLEAEVLLGMGFNYTRINQYQQALDYFNQALPILQEMGERSGEATILNNIGTVYDDIGQPQKALDYYNQALLISQEIGDHTGEAGTLNNIGRAYNIIGQPEKALDYYNQALPISQEIGDRDGEATTLNNIGAVYDYIGQPEKALDYYNQALSISQEIGDRAVEAGTLNNIGVIYHSIGQPEKALDYYNQALPISQEIGNRSGVAATLTNIGGVYDIIGQPEKALDYYNQALPISQEIGNRFGVAANLNYIGGVYHSIGQPKKALDYYNQALPISQEIGDRSGVATTLNNIGVVYDIIGQPEKALDYLNQALPILQEVSNRSMEASTLNNIGAVYLDIGQPQKALGYFNQALPIQQEIGDRDGEATTLNNIGAVYNIIGQPEKALDYYSQALPIQQEIGDRSGVATTLNNIGFVYDIIGQPEKALDYYSQALPISQEIGDRSGVATTLNNIGVVYGRIGQRDKALNYYNQALPIRREVGTRIGEATTLHNIGLTYENQAKIAQAISYYQEAIEVKESIQGEIKVEELKASFSSQQVNTYDRLINLLWQKGDFEEAFNYAERAKARAFLDQLANGRIDFRADADSKLLEQEQAFKNQIIALRQQLITLHNRPSNKWDTDTIAQTETQLANHEKDYQDLLLQIKIQSPETADLISVDVASLSEIQDLLDADTTLVEYFVTENRTLAFIITKNSFKTVTLNVTREQFTEELTLFRDLADIDEPHPQELQNLHDWLITPLQPHLNTANIAIVPHGILHYLPFAALTDGNRYFGDDYALSTLPSASILRFLPEKRKSQTNSVLALGDADVPGLSPLNFARKEVQTIAQLFNSQPLLGKTATETSVWSKATQSGILHLAVHGEFNPLNTLFSAIRLAGDTENDGRLEVHEVYGLDLTKTTNLVILSACQTNIGKLSQGDEVVGLNRAFLYAGTPTVIASLWNVDDAATGLLMERFYTHWQAGMNKAEALRQAQIEVRKDYPHPYFWAAFSLTGDGGR